MRCCDVLTIRSAEPATDPGGANCVERMGMMCGANFVSRLRTAQVAFSEHEGPLSIKCVFRGQEAYAVEGTRLIVDADSYLLLNDGQRYGSRIEAQREVDSFCFWFRPGFVESLLSELRSPIEGALEERHGSGSRPLAFFERLYPHDDLVSPVLRRVHTAFTEGWLTRDWLDEQFHVLAARLLQQHRSVHREVERLPAVRHATRVELYRRLYRARDFLEGSLTANVTLSDVASAACMSPHHFLRLFKATFNETPRQYQVRRRMEKARALLQHTDLPVTQICYDLGFESLGSFSWLFRRLHGAPPSQYRWQSRGESAGNRAFGEARGPLPD